MPSNARPTGIESRDDAPPGMLTFVARHYARQAKPDRALAPLSTFATLAPPAVKEGGMPRSANERSTCAASESECPAPRVPSVVERIGGRGERSAFRVKRKRERVSAEPTERHGEAADQGRAKRSRNKPLVCSGALPPAVVEACLRPV